MSFEGVIKDAELRFIKTNGYPPKYLLLNMYGYMKLKQETAVRLGKDDLEWDDDFSNYEGLHVLVSQDQGFDEFVLTA